MTNYNGAYISRIFKQIVGMNLSTYVTSCRISKAKELLMHGNDNISEIAEKVGFDSSQYFSNVFKRMVGTTPGEYRNLAAKQETIT